MSNIFINGDSIEITLNLYLILNIYLSYQNTYKSTIFNNMKMLMNAIIIIFYSKKKKMDVNVINLASY